MTSPRDVGRFVVCGKCQALRGGPIDHIGDVAVWQLCDCASAEERSAQPRVGDFNAAFELCRCCGMEALRSGSRWSVWFCATCQERVRELNAESGSCVVPIGRHTLMNGAEFDPSPDSASRTFVEQLKSLFHEMAETAAWAPAAVRLNLAAAALPAGEDIALDAYLAAVGTLAYLKPQRFDEMVNPSARPPS